MICLLPVGSRFRRRGGSAGKPRLHKGTARLVLLSLALVLHKKDILGMHVHIPCSTCHTLEWIYLLFTTLALLKNEVSQLCHAGVT
jgi:hypothetical protein